MRLVRIAACLLLAAGFTSCASDDADEPSATDASDATNTLSITAREYEFEVSGTPTAGRLTLDISNAGEEWHELAMTKLLDGKTVDDLRAALRAAGEDDDPFEGISDDAGEAIDDLGGSQFPGTSYEIAGSGIVPGEYALLCFVPNADGTPHWNLGMLTGFTIDEGTGGNAPEAADVTFTAGDDGLEGPEQVDAGERAIRIVNDSSGTRELGLLRVKDGKTMADVAKSLEAADEGPPAPASAPFDYFAYVFDAEQDRTLTVDLTPGTWALQAADPEDESTLPPDKDPFAVVFTVS